MEEEDGVQHETHRGMHLLRTEEKAGRTPSK